MTQEVLPEVTAVLADYGAILKDSPPPKELKQCSFPEVNKFHMEGDNEQAARQ